MVSLQPFGDLPQINLDAEGDPNGFCTWPSYDRSASWAAPFHTSRLADMIASEAMLEATPARNLSTMQRFIVGSELPISASLFQLDNTSSSRLPRSFHFNTQYEPQTPWPFPEGSARYGSPDNYRSSWSVSSGSSSINSSSTSHCQYPRADLHVAHPSPPQSSDSSEYVSSQDTAYYQPFSTFHMDTATGGGSCALREIQQYPSPAEEPENPIECEDGGEVKIEYAYCEQESIHYHGKMNTGEQHCRRVQEDEVHDMHDTIRAESVQPLEVKIEDPADSDYEPGSSGSKRRRRASQFSVSSRTSSKRTKAAHTKRGSIATTRSGGAGKRTKTTGSLPGSGTGSSSNAVEAPRPFPCPLAGYSCPATFASKNEWKRHVSTQHVRLGFWRCKLCPSSLDGGATVSYNDFNRKDLFAQHLRRMHFAPDQQQHGKDQRHHHQHQHQHESHPSTSSSSASTTPPQPQPQPQPQPTTTIITESTMPAFQKTCYRRLRDPPPTSNCLFCTRSFSGPGSWDERMEHVGRHFESARKRQVQLQLQQQQQQGHASTGARVGAGADAAGAGAGVVAVERWREDPALRAWLCREGLVRRDARGGWALGDGRPRRGEDDGSSGGSGEEGGGGVDVETEDAEGDVGLGLECEE